VKTQTLFSKVEFASQFGDTEPADASKHLSGGHNRENISIDSPRHVFTRRGPHPDILQAAQRLPRLMAAMKLRQHNTLIAIG